MNSSEQSKERSNLSVSHRFGVDRTPLYKPGLPIELVAREKGMDPSKIIKLASNENPLGPSPKAVEAVKVALNDLHRYPDGGAWELTHKLAEQSGLSANQFIIGNGSNEILELVAQVFLEPGTNAVMGEYPFVVYPIVTQHFGAEIRKAPMPDLRHDLDEILKLVDEKTRVVFIASPNNPTPHDIPRDEMEAFVQKLPEHVLLCFDGAYQEYLDDPFDPIPSIQNGKSILAVRTFSKIYGLAGNRIGYAYGSEELVALLMRARQPFSVNSLALAGALAALEDVEFVAKCKVLNQQGIAQLKEGFEKLNLEYEAGCANFVLVRVDDTRECCEFLVEKGVIVRSMSPFSLDGWIRVSVGLPAENERLLDSLAEYFQQS